jgi:hypothetical protein
LDELNLKRIEYGKKFPMSLGFPEEPVQLKRRGCEVINALLALKFAVAGEGRYGEIWRADRPLLNINFF